MIAVVRGLLLDRLATGDRSRTDDAFRLTSRKSALTRHDFREFLQTKQSIRAILRSRSLAQEAGTSVRQIYYATRSGGTTLDVGAGGGNPFASALIELADEPELRLRDLAPRLRAVTAEKSNGHQIVQWVGSAHRSNWCFANSPAAWQERREALVLVVSDYSQFNPGASLRGAAGDERRISVMLAQHGFSVTQAIAPRRPALLAALRAFKLRSQQADIAVIYSTGHGIEVENEVFLLPGDYPLGCGYGRAHLRRRAVRVERMAHAACALRVNLVFFGGCRTHTGPTLSEVGAGAP
jgi:hypothetical protein